MDPRVGLFGATVAALGILIAASMASGQDVDSGATGSESAPLPPPPEIGPAVAPPPIIKPKPKPRPEDSASPVAPAPPKVLRSPVAVLQVLDKITAETLRFEAPVGRRVRYKTLVLQVKACETRDYDAAQPRASAYLTIDARQSSGRDGSTTTDQVFNGWMFAFAPALHALRHPVYDVWLIACSASTPVA